INVPRPGAFGYEAGTPLFIADKTFLWTTERRGAWTLEVSDVRGIVVREITAPDFGLPPLVGPAASSAIVEAQTDPTKQDLWRVPLDGKPPTRITDGDGVSS